MWSWSRSPGSTTGDAFGQPAAGGGAFGQPDAGGASGASTGGVFGAAQEGGEYPPEDLR